MRLRLLLTVAPLLLIAACAAPTEVADVPPAAPPEPLGHPSYETFDPAGFEAEPSAQPTRAEVEHDVPAALMAGTIIQRETRRSDEPAVVQGYRIQLFSSESKPSADAVRDDVSAWWRTVQREPGVEEAFRFGLRPAVVFSRPYYRVRIGAFPDRADATEALQIIRQRYPEAFIVPDTITLSGD